MRAGINRDPISLGAAIQEEVLESGSPCLSIFRSEQLQGETRHATLRRISQEALIPHRKIMDSTVQELQLNRFISCFDEPEANPTRGIN